MVSFHSALPKSKSQVQDDSIMGTNNSSIVSKRSVERLYYPNEPQFFRGFVKKPQRRSPLINRGYWLRMKAVDRIVHHFLKESSPKQKVVINLGCGYDPLPWQSIVRYPAHCAGVKFIDIDYKDLMVRKRDTVSLTKELMSFLSNVELSDENVLFRSDQYLQLGCDLRDLKLLSQTLASVIDFENSHILLTAEVSITYMEVEAADALIQWAGNLPDARFCLLEQIIPGGTEHPFALTMMAHFKKLNTPIRAVQKYPTNTSQENRFKTLGWSSASARNLWQLWNDTNFITLQERTSLDFVEPFDEWEEFALFGCHYFLLVADTLPSSTFEFSKENILASKTSCQKPKAGVELEMVYSENPKLQGCRRFGAIVPLRKYRQKQDRVGVFGGMGLDTRVNTCDMYATEHSESMSLNDGAMSQVPSSRMGHTITNLGETGAILVGGRTSPDNALADCWLYHKWLNVWERIDDLPQPQYRHGAVNLGCGYVLIAPGKKDSRTINLEFYIWSRNLGWVTCLQKSDKKPLPSFGVTFAVYEKPDNGMGLKCGILAGGISNDGRLLYDVWEWDLRGMSGQEPVISFKLAAVKVSSFLPLQSIARFGASVVNHRGQIWVIGGIVQDELLDETKAFVSIDSDFQIYQSVISRNSLSPPQPLLIGSSIATIGDSLLVAGGSAVCFSFGTFWNKGCYTFRHLDGREKYDLQCPIRVPECWSFIHTTAPVKPAKLPTEMTPSISKNSLIGIPRVRIGSAFDFGQIVREGKPVIIEGLDLGPCTSLWTSNYLKENLGSTREVVVHEATSQHMDFKSKNFAYSTKSFGDFLDEVSNGGRLYLRSLSVHRPTEVPADISKDFPTISGDFRLPPELSLVRDNAHSYPLRISGPVIMWLHYDVMANVLCQIKESKRLLLFPPSDVEFLDFEAGASSSSTNVFDGQNSIPAKAHPHEALLASGDVLFLPPLWLHTACPSTGMSVAVNVFFRNLSSGYAVGKDVYGNRDLQAYERGRQDIAKVIRSFDSLPDDIRGFYLQRLLKEFEEKTH